MLPNQYDYNTFYKISWEGRSSTDNTTTVFKPCTDWNIQIHPISITKPNNINKKENCIKYYSIKELQEEHEKNCIFVKFFEEIYYMFLRFINNIRQFIKEGKWKIQRMNKGWATCDTWDISSYISTVLIGLLKDFKKDNMSVPIHFSEKQWEKIIDNIIYTFTIEKEIANQETMILKKSQDKKLTEHLDIKILTTKEIQKYNKGWEYFRKYFQCLWN